MNDIFYISLGNLVCILHLLRISVWPGHISSGQRHGVSGCIVSAALGAWQGTSVGRECLKSSTGTFCVIALITAPFLLFYPSDSPSSFSK